jgi:DNA-binding transcriptional LysR family regulator
MAHLRSNNKEFIMNLHTTDWNKFRTFYHVAKAESFTKAAENLHISQPALSRRISSLEENLNMRLLKRVPRGVIPTEEGKALLETVDAMLNVFLRYGEKVNNKNEEPQGLLKVAMLKTLPGLHLSWLIPKFLKAYPRMKLALMDSDREVGFSTYQFDAAIREFDENALNMEQIYLTTSHISVYASPEYLQLNGTPQKAGDLDKHCLIALGNPDKLSSCAANWVLQVGLSQGQQRTPSLCVSSIAEMKWAVKAGLGIAALPEEYITKDLCLVRVLTDIPSLSLDLYYVYPSYHKETKRVTAYGEFLADQLKTFNPVKTQEKGEKIRFFGLESAFQPSYAQHEA